MGSPTPTGPGIVQPRMDPVLQTSTGHWTKEAEEAVAEYVPPKNRGQRGHWGALLARGNMTRNGGAEFENGLRAGMASGIVQEQG